jgi:DNA repair exonuclease SbcCD ATPase subunit
MTTAPVAPGSIGSAIEPAKLQVYLGELDDWLRARRTQLDELDAAALAANRGGQVAGDMMLSMALWKAVSDRYQLIFATWDGGRVLQSERERISSLIWGRLDGASELPGGLAVSVPEACRLSDALAAQLRTTLSLVPGADAAAARIKQLRAQLERLRDQVALEPANARASAAERVAGLAQRLAEVTEKAQRGADVGGLLPPLESDATTCERDLIVGNAQRRDARDQLVSVRELRADLASRETALERLAEQCVRTVDPAPHYAVPDVDALGPVPNTPEAIRTYLHRLERVSEALNLAQHKYADALAEHTELADLLDAYVAKAKALGVADRTDLADSERQAREVLARRPAPMKVCRQLVTTYQTWLNQADNGKGSKKESA